MRRLTSFVTIFLLLAAAAPLLACVTGVAMSHAESACCREMHGQCGEMAKQGCCRTEVRTDDAPQMATAYPSFAVAWVCVAQLTAQTDLLHSNIVRYDRAPLENSPPGLTAATSTLLRI